VLVGRRVAVRVAHGVREELEQRIDHQSARVCAYVVVQEADQDLEERLRGQQRRLVALRGPLNSAGL
jgi:hypothetical protein